MSTRTSRRDDDDARPNDGVHMTSAHDEPNLHDVMEPEESPRPDRREHAKAPPRPDEDELGARADEELEEATEEWSERH
jgi:hypothetical protein